MLFTFLTSSLSTQTDHIKLLYIFKIIIIIFLCIYVSGYLDFCKRRKWICEGRRIVYEKENRISIRFKADFSFLNLMFSDENSIQLSCEIPNKYLTLYGVLVLAIHLRKNSWNISRSNFKRIFSKNILHQIKCNRRKRLCVFVCDINNGNVKEN